MKMNLSGLHQLSLIFFLSACGEESGDKGTNPDTHSNLDSQAVSLKVLANQDFTNSSYRVKAGDKFQLKATGEVSVGLIDASNPANIKAQTGDANGHGHYGYDAAASRWVSYSGTMDFNCGLRRGITMVKNLKSDGSIEDITSPIESYGPCCSSVRRADLHPNPVVRSFVNGQSLFTSPPNRCVSTARFGALLMKIVPDGKTVEEIAPVFVGKNYETTAYEATTEGSLYFAVNDIVITNDNTGAFDLSIVPAP